jgi:hypothetical protein
MNQPNGHPGYGFKLRGPKGRRTKVADLPEQQFQPSTLPSPIPSVLSHRRCNICSPIQ